MVMPLDRVYVCVGGGGGGGGGGGALSMLTLLFALLQT